MIFRIIIAKMIIEMDHLDCSISSVLNEGWSLVGFAYVFERSRRCHSIRLILRGRRCIFSVIRDIFRGPSTTPSVFFQELEFSDIEISRNKGWET